MLRDLESNIKVSAGSLGHNILEKTTLSIPKPIKH